MYCRNKMAYDLHGELVLTTLDDFLAKRDPIAKKEFHNNPFWSEVSGDIVVTSGMNFSPQPPQGKHKQ